MTPVVSMTADNSTSITTCSGWPT